MVAYSFQKVFAPKIEIGEKTHTMRMPRTGRSRHARPGEQLQLYVGMRTKHCRKIIADQTCTFSVPMLIKAETVKGLTFIGIADESGRKPFIKTFETPNDLDAFAVKDGFENIAAMTAFWAKHNQFQSGELPQVLINWGDLP